MLWTLVYIVMTQGSSGGVEMATWPAGLQFETRQAGTEAANAGAPGLMKGEPNYIGPGGPNPNAVTIRPICFPVAK